MNRVHRYVRRVPPVASPIRRPLENDLNHDSFFLSFFLSLSRNCELAFATRFFPSPFSLPFLEEQIAQKSPLQKISSQASLERIRADPLLEAGISKFSSKFLQRVNEKKKKNVKLTKSERKLFADETEQRDGRERRGARRDDEQLFPEDVDGHDNDDDDDHADNPDVHVHDDCDVNGSGIRARGIRGVDIVDGAAEGAAMPRASHHAGHVVHHVAHHGLLVHGGRQIVDQRPLLLTCVAEKIRL